MIKDNDDMAGCKININGESVEHVSEFVSGKCVYKGWYDYKDVERRVNERKSD